MQKRLGFNREADPEPPKVSIERIREFVLQQASRIELVLLGNREAAKQALRTHFKPLVLSPKETPDGPVFTVQGGWICFLVSKM